MNINNFQGDLTGTSAKVCSLHARHGAEQYAGDLECVFDGYHLDRAMLKISEAANGLMPSLLHAG